MGLAPLNTPLHAQPRSRLNTTTPLPVPGPFHPQRRLMSPASEEATSPRPGENLQRSPRYRPLSPDFGVVQDIQDEASENDADESILLGPELLSSLERPTDDDEGATRLGWRGWLSVAAFGVISGSVIIIAGNARKDSKMDRRQRSYLLNDRSYY